MLDVWPKWFKRDVLGYELPNYLNIPYFKFVEILFLLNLLVLSFTLIVLLLFLLLLVLLVLRYSHSFFPESVNEVHV